jgi:hypothetical protein
MVPLAKLTRVIALVLAALWVVFVIWSCGSGYLALSQPGLSKADETRIWSNLVAEGVVNSVLLGGLAGAAAAVSAWVGRRARPMTEGDSRQ